MGPLSRGLVLGSEAVTEAGGGSSCLPKCHRASFGKSVLLALLGVPGLLSLCTPSKKGNVFDQTLYANSSPAGQPATKRMLLTGASGSWKIGELERVQRSSAHRAVGLGSRTGEERRRDLG